MPSRTDATPWLLAAAGALILAAAPAQYLGRQQDDLFYIIGAHSLAEGRYALLTALGTPPLTDVTPGLPILLTPLAWLAPDRMGLFQIFAALLLAACPWAVWAWLKTKLGETEALLGALVFATSPLVLAQSGCVMSETPYTLLCLLFLSLLERPKPSAAAPWILLAITQIRGAGLSLVPGALPRSMRDRGWKETGRLLAPTAIGLLLWSYWSESRAGRVDNFSEWTISYQGRTWTEALMVPLDNVLFYLKAYGGCFLPHNWGRTSAGTWLGGVLAALSLWGAARKAKWDWTEPAVLSLGAALGMHVFWGWQYERYLLPLLPLILYTAADGLRKHARFLFGAMLACQIAFHVPHWLKPNHMSFPELAPAYGWLKENSTPQDGLASLLFVRDGFLSGLPATSIPDAADPAELSRKLKDRRVRWVLFQRVEVGLTRDHSSFLRRAVQDARARLADPRFFRRAHSDHDYGFEIFEVRDR